MTDLDTIRRVIPNTKEQESVLAVAVGIACALGFIAATAGAAIRWMFS